MSPPPPTHPHSDLTVNGKEAKGNKEAAAEGKDDAKKIKGSGADARRRAIGTLMGCDSKVSADGAFVVELDTADLMDFSLGVDGAEDLVIGTEGLISPELAAALGKRGSMCAVTKCGLAGGPAHLGPRTHRLRLDDSAHVRFAAPCMNK